jgi:F420-non-reducing hydrogenase iron-sulfur subunit
MFEPRIVCFFCKWCTYAGADLAGTSRKQYPPNGVVVRVNCTGRVDPQHVLWAFREGADGVLIGGCHPGDCHYEEGNYKTMRRVPLLHRLMDGVGIDPDRLRLEWISAAEGGKLVQVMNQFVDTVRDLGPLELPPEAARGNGGAAQRAAAALAKSKAPKKKATPKKRASAKAKSKKGGARKSTAKAKPKSAKARAKTKKKSAPRGKGRRAATRTKAARKTSGKSAARKRSVSRKPAARKATRKKTATKKTRTGRTSKKR